MKRTVEKFERVRIVLSNPPGMKSLCRPELAPGTDINVILARQGINPTVPVAPVRYGEIDFDLDLQRAFQSVQSVEEGFQKLPADVREHYGTAQNMMKAAARGEYAPFMKERSDRLDKEAREKKAAEHRASVKEERELSRSLDREEAFEEFERSGGVKPPKGGSRR